MNMNLLLGALAFWIAAWYVNERLVRLNPSGSVAARAVDIAVPALFGITLLVIWEGVTRGLNVSPILLPPPSMIWARILDSVPILWADFQQPFLKAVIMGFVMGCGSGFVVAIAVDRSPFLQRGLLPLGNFVSALPIIGVAPIMVMWFGFDWPSKAAVVIVMTFFPMLVNIAQPFKSSGMMLTCRKDSGITSPADFPGNTLGVWFFGNEYPFLSWMSQLGISTDGGENGVEVLKQGFNVDPILQGQAACVSTMTDNEYWQIIDAGLSADDLVTFKYEDEGVATLEDGLYVLEDRLADPGFANDLVRFVRASMRGWKWAEQNPDAAADIVLENDETGAQTIEHQRRMMGEIAKLTAGSNGALDPADFQRTVDTLLGGGSDPVITKQPEGAWTSVITDEALN